MKVLGISFGRKMKCSEIMVKEALFAAKAMGAEVEFISTMDMEIGHCKACGACSAARDKGKTPKCIIKDDYQKLEDAVLNADGIILAAPVYAVGIVGQFKNFVDRFGPMHDRAALVEAQKQRIADGKTGSDLLDERNFKNRYVGYISVGGAYTQNWVSLGLPMLHLFDFSANMRSVGHIDALDQGRKASPLLDPELMQQCKELGEIVAGSIGKSYDEVGWYGDQGTCPVCHNNIMTMTGTTLVECPICGITGKLVIEGDKVSVEFSEEQKNRARWTVAGLYEHYYEIKGMKDVAIPKIMANKEKLAQMQVKYETFEV